MIFTSALTWFFLRTVPSSRNAKPACIASTITAPMRMNSVSLLAFNASMVSPLAIAPRRRSFPTAGSASRFAAARVRRDLSRRRRRRCVPLRLGDDFRIGGIAKIVRRHDLHAVLVEHVLHVGVKAGEHLGARPRLARSRLA